MSALCWREWALVAYAWMSLWRIRISLLRGRPLPRLRRALARQSDLPGGLLPEHIARAVRLASRLHPGRCACLERSLCLESLLLRSGIDAELRFGVSRSGSELAAHAWVESGGVPLGEPREVASRYRPLIAAASKPEL